ncbi:Hpt domain-containing protein [Candidatus Thiothrix anitrata]|uniref:Hpt domain-containing protein n=1 Tax=Candidatus Thiothrix anitrata TaxID=2823902 RepID=A0ABX7X829_9GAMM|nr:Hpt domain-containing protein [Candidatus Thiothrix anitrata]QTR50250.1 Hpt domain-containing protein [Candidatus Thiothrix anitrata]
MTSTTIQIIDEDTYYELQEIMADEFAELLAVFHEDAAASLANLQQYIVQGETQQVGALCHKLKSSSRLIGAFHMAELARLLEEYKDNNNQLLATTYCQQLAEAYTEVCQWLAEHTNNLST